MSTTTIRMKARLKFRVARAARRTGVAPHALIVDAVERRVEEVEVDTEFHRLADRRWAEFLSVGKTISWKDGKVFLEALARGEKVRRPRARRLRRR